MWLELAGGRRLVAFALRDGSFSFAAVPVGVHSLGVEHGQLLYPTLRLDVGAARKGRVAATVVDVVGVSRVQHKLRRSCQCRAFPAAGPLPCITPCLACESPAAPAAAGAALSRRPRAALPPPAPQASPIPHPLLLRPIAGLEWFERRQPFSLMGFLKTPYGMMAGFMVFSLFILPRLKVGAALGVQGPWAGLGGMPAGGGSGRKQPPAAAAAAAAAPQPLLRHMLLCAAD